MTKHILLFVAFLLFIGIISAQNHMDIMTTITGEHDFAEMGFIMTTLDWNGDGYDDLVIDESGWKPPEFQSDPSVNSFGKLNIYFGGANFDNIPEMIIPGSHELEYWATISICNAEDMNGDSIDELALFRATMYEDHNDQHYDLQLCVFIGGATPDTIPDFVLTFPREDYDNGYGYIRSLGDVNQDGFNDIGYVLRKNTLAMSYTFNILYGGSMQSTLIRIDGSSSDASSLIGVGDINADGFDDFCMGYTNIVNNTRLSKMILYFGNASSVFADSLLLCESSNAYRTFSFPAGDVNGDGFADFVSAFSEISARLYFGGTGFDSTHYVEISPPYCGSGMGEGFGHGDVNGDGLDDLMGSFCTQANGNGTARLWLGGVPMNGLPDLNFPPPVFYSDREMFGFCLTMGDYNGDGYCDAAISAPFDYAGFPVPGRVFIYAGNHQLDDTPVADATETPAISKLRLYPNPLQPQHSNLNVKFSKTTPLNPPSGRGVMATFEIYNIRGQKVKSFIVSAEQSKTGSANYNLNDLSSGVYVCVFSCGQTQHRGKITVIS